LAARSKLIFVRVESSKNALTIVMPRSAGIFLTSRCPTASISTAVSSRVVI